MQPALRDRNTLAPIVRLRGVELIVATDERQIDDLKGIQAKAHANGVTDVVWMTRAQALALEPFDPGVPFRDTAVEGVALDLTGLGDRRPVEPGRGDQLGQLRHRPRACSVNIDPSAC